MKTIIPIILMVLLCSCNNYLQLVQIQGKEDISIKDDRLVYEDANCKISYNFWCEGGYSGFEFHNKTDQMIKIDLSECFFIKNGYANDYYQDRTFIEQQSFGSSITSMFMNSQSRGEYSSSTTYPIGFIGQPYKTSHKGRSSQSSSSQGTSSSFSASKSVGVEVAEQKVISIPPHSTKAVRGFVINPSLYRNCDLLLYPDYNSQRSIRAKQKVSTQKFSFNESPLIFSNHIKYYVGDQKAGHLVKNEFYMDEVKNMNYKDATRKVYSEWCGDKQAKIEVVKDASINKFYLLYHRATNNEKVKH